MLVRRRERIESEQQVNMDKMAMSNRLGKTTKRWRKRWVATAGREDNRQRNGISNESGGGACTEPKEGKRIIKPSKSSARRQPPTSGPSHRRNLRSRENGSTPRVLIPYDERQFVELSHDDLEFAPECADVLE